MSSISSVSASAPVSSSNADKIEKQIKELKKSIASEEQSDDDDKVKALKVAQYQAQIQQLEAALKAEKSRGQKPDPNAAPPKSENSSALDKLV